MISPSLRLLLEVWVWYICPNRIKKYMAMNFLLWQSTFYWKVLNVKTHRLLKEKCFCNLCIAINSNLLDENRTQDKVAARPIWRKHRKRRKVIKSISKEALSNKKHNQQFQKTHCNKIALDSTKLAIFRRFGVTRN